MKNNMDLNKICMLIFAAFVVIVLIFFVLKIMRNKTKEDFSNPIESCSGSCSI